MREQLDTSKAQQENDAVEMLKKHLALMQTRQQSKPHSQQQASGQLSIGSNSQRSSNLSSSKRRNLQLAEVKEQQPRILEESSSDSNSSLTLKKKAKGKLIKYVK